MATRIPRWYGTFPRVLGRYVREQARARLETAVHKMTGMPAARLGLADRGVLTRGRCAPTWWCSIRRPSRDQATFEEPHQYPVGIDYVLVNGTAAVDAGKYTNARAGLVLKRAGGATRRR